MVHLNRSRSLATRRPTAATVQDVVIGAQFGLLQVEAEAEPYMWRGRVTHRCWHCVCDCGNEVTVRQDALTSGHTRSCGCERTRVAVETHTQHGGRSNGRRGEGYDAWRHLRRMARAGLTSAPTSWLGPDGYAAFLAAVGPCPGPRHRLRCRDGRSPRMARNWMWVEDPPRAPAPRWWLRYRGTLMSFRELARATGVKYATLVKRFERGQRVVEGASNPVRAARIWSAAE
jgi:hypothetical protein